MPFITLEEMDKMAEKIEAELGIGNVKESEAYKELAAAIDEADRHNQERKVRERPRQMMDVGDVQEALSVSESTAYGVIRRLNQELDKAGYITVRGKVSRAYFEKRTYGVSANAEWQRNNHICGPEPERNGLGAADNPVV